MLPTNSAGTGLKDEVRDSALIGQLPLWTNHDSNSFIVGLPLPVAGNMW